MMTLENYRTKRFKTNPPLAVPRSRSKLDAKRFYFSKLPKSIQSNKKFKCILFLPETWIDTFPVGSMLLSMWLNGSSKLNDGLTIISETTGRISTHKYWKFNFLDQNLAKMPELRRLLNTASNDYLEKLASASNSRDSILRKRIEKDLYTQRDNISAATETAHGAFHPPHFGLPPYYYFHSFPFNGVVDTFVNPALRNAYDDNTDFDVSFNRCSIFCYVKILAKKVDHTLRIKFTKVGLRFHDSYDFDGTQPLGKWPIDKTEEECLIWNSDFQDFREQFLPIYNKACGEISDPGIILKCDDYKIVSDIVEIDIPDDKSPSISLENYFTT